MWCYMDAWWTDRWDKFIDNCSCAKYFPLFCSWRRVTMPNNRQTRRQRKSASTYWWQGLYGWNARIMALASASIEYLCIATKYDDQCVAIPFVCIYTKFYSEHNLLIICECIVSSSQGRHYGNLTYLKIKINLND